MPNLQPIRILEVDEIIAVDTSVTSKHYNLEDLLISIQGESNINNYNLREIIILNNKDYQIFIRNFFETHYFIENLYGRYTPNNSKRLCLIIFNLDTQDMIAVDTQGYEYSRYTGVVQNPTKIIDLVNRHITPVEIKNKDTFFDLVEIVTSSYHNLTKDDVHFALNPINGFFVPTLNFIECDRKFRNIAPIDYILKHDPTFGITLNIAKENNGSLNPNHCTIGELANYLHISLISSTDTKSRIYTLFRKLETFN